MNYPCSSCSRTFSNKTTCNKHMVYCATAIEIKRCQNEPSEKKYTEVQRDKIINMLIWQNHQLKKQVASLANKIQVFQKKRRVEIITWLNAKRKPRFGWKDFIKQTDVREQHFITALNNSLVDGVEECLKEVLLDPELPLIAFRQKDKTLYVFDDDVWKLQEKDAFTKSMQTLVFKIQQYYFIWRRNNQALLDSSEEWKNKDIEYSRKMMGTDTTIISLLGKLYANVYDTIKKDMDEFINEDDLSGDGDEECISENSSLTS